MFKRILFFLSTILCSLPSIASDDTYDGTYTLEMRLDGSGYSYTYNTCFIKITDGMGDIEFDYKMTQGSTASTNYVQTTGSGSGWFEGTTFKGNGSGVITTYEKGKQDSEFGFQFTMNGTVEPEKKLSGTFIFTENGEPVNGTFTGMCKEKVEEEGVDDDHAYFNHLSGQIEILTPGEDDYKVAKLDTKIPVNSYIKSDEDASAEIVFKNKTSYLLGPKTTIKIVRPPEDPHPKLSLVMGNIWINVKKMIKDGSMEIDYNQAVAGIKGTTLICEDDGTTSTLKVIEGTVWFKSKTDPKTHIKVEAGEMISATKSGLGTKTTFDVDAETAKWDKYRNTSIIDKILGSTLYIVIAGAALLLLIALIVFLILRRRKSKKRKQKTVTGEVNETNHSHNQQQKAVPIIPPDIQPVVDKTVPSVKPRQFCTSCGAMLKPEAKFCHSCAKPVVKK